MRYFVILLIFVGSVMLAPNAFASHDPTQAYHHPVRIDPIMKDTNIEFINFSYTNTIGEPIKFIIEKIRDSNCNSYNVKITDKDGKFVWGGGADIDCSSASISSGIPVQTKIGYNGNHPIIINDSGKYYLEVEFSDVFIKREFVVRQNHTGVTLDDIVYPILSPLKQFKAGMSIHEIQCKKGLVEVIKNSDNSPACVTLQTKEKLMQRGWAEPLGNIIKQRAVYSEPFPIPESETKKLFKSTDDWDSLGLEYNDDLYCGSADEELPDHCYSLEEIVFGNARKGWTVFPGGVGPVPPENFTLTKIYKDSGFGMPTLNFTAMLDDKIFVNKCESNGGVWNYTYHDCENLWWQICRDVGGIMIQVDISEPCTGGVCLDRKVYRMSCVFEYEN